MTQVSQTRLLREVEFETDDLNGETEQTVVSTTQDTTGRLWPPAFSSNRYIDVSRSLLYLLEHTVSDLNQFYNSDFSSFKLADGRQKFNYGIMTKL